MSEPTRAIFPSGLTRRDLLAGAAALGITPLTAGKTSAMSRHVPNRPIDVEAAFTPEALFAHVEAYDALGIHRAASSGDLATADWMETWLTGLGFETRRQPFSVDYFEPGETFVEAEGGARVEGFAQWPVAPSGPEGVRARLGLYSDYAPNEPLKGAIAVIEFAHQRPSAFSDPAYRVPVEAAIGFGASAVVGVTSGPSAEMIALNAAPDRPAFGVPVIMIAPRDARPILEAAGQRRPGRVVLDGAGPAPREAVNVIGRLDRGGKTVVVTTPQSGWFHCAGERGPGIAAWRALAVWAAAQEDRELSFLFASMSGHELENTGAHLFLEKIAPAQEDLALWVHLGAGFAARDYHEATPGLLFPLPSADSRRFLMGAPEFIPVLREAFAGLPGLENAYPVTPEDAAGELQAIAAAGYEKIFGAFGGHRFHHAVADRTDKTDGAMLREAALAFRQAMEALLSGTG